MRVGYLDHICYSSIYLLHLLSGSFIFCLARVESLSHLSLTFHTIPFHSCRSYALNRLRSVDLVATLSSSFALKFVVVAHSASRRCQSITSVDRCRPVEPPASRRWVMVCCCWWWWPVHQVRWIFCCSHALLLPVVDVATSMLPVVALLKLLYVALRVAVLVVVILFHFCTRLPFSFLHLLHHIPFLCCARCYRCRVAQLLPRRVLPHLPRFCTWVAVVAVDRCVEPPVDLSFEVEYLVLSIYIVLSILNLYSSIYHIFSVEFCRVVDVIYLLSIDVDRRWPARCVVDLLSTTFLFCQSILPVDLGALLTLLTSQHCQLLL